MKVAVVYESLFGNTREVAEAISAGVREARPEAAVDCVPVDDATAEALAAVDLLVVGGPTHIRGMSSGRSRRRGVAGERQAEDSGEPAHELEPDAEGPGLRDWFDALPEDRQGRLAAAFDTRLPNPLAGGAARGVARRLRHHGYALVAEPEGFQVEGSYGPLSNGEAERARRWGAALVG